MVYQHANNELQVASKELHEAKPASTSPAQLSESHGLGTSTLSDMRAINKPGGGDWTSLSHINFIEGGSAQRDLGDTLRTPPTTDATTPNRAEKAVKTELPNLTLDGTEKRNPVVTTGEKPSFTSKDISACFERNQPKIEAIFPTGPDGRDNLEKNMLATQYIMNKEGYSTQALTPAQIETLGGKAVERLNKIVDEDKAKHLTAPNVKGH